MEKKTLNPNPIQILAHHVAKLSGNDFHDKRKGIKTASIYANARSYLLLRGKDVRYLDLIMENEFCDGSPIRLFSKYGLILRAQILNNYAGEKILHPYEKHNHTAE